MKRRKRNELITPNKKTYSLCLTTNDKQFVEELNKRLPKFYNKSQMLEHYLRIGLKLETKK